jgi:hypothetical protein
MVNDDQVSLSQHAIDIVSRNNQAIAQMLRGDYASATSTLTCLLKPAKEFVRIYQSQVSPQIPPANTRGASQQEAAQAALSLVK